MTPISSITRLSLSALLLAGLNGPVIVAQGSASCTVTAADLSSATVQTAINGAAAGSVICLPTGSVTWTTAVNINKAITLKGAGAGGYFGRSTTSLAIGTGSKTFTTGSGLTFTVGETITARYPNRDGADAMTGTVTSYSGTTLVLNITSVTGSGGFAVWIFERPALTTIINSAVSSSFQGMLSVTESTTGNIAIQGIHFVVGTASNGDHIFVAGATNGKPVLVHDNWFSTSNALGGMHTNVNRGVVYRNSFFNALCSGTPASGCTAQIGGGVGMKNETLLSSWTSASTMGAMDTDGTHNLYVEDNVFVGYWQSANGFDGGARVVMRHNTFDNSGLTSHGADTETLGVRHYEIYDNVFIFDVMGTGGSETYNLNYWFFVRGGTGVITDNVMPDITSSYWGNKTEIGLIIINLQRNTGPDPCWGANIAGNQYPAPRQVGMGRVTGSGGNDSITYAGDSEPLYIWNNTGSYAVGVQDDGSGQCTNPDSSANYIVSGRDYFWNAGAKPGYTKYTYPHPLAQGAGTTAPSTPKNLRISS